MRRREFMTLLGGAVTWPLAVRAQQAARIVRIGYLMTSSPDSPEGRLFLDAFRQGLAERGLVEGQNIAIEPRAADGRTERFPALAAELAHLKVDLIVASNTPAARAAQEATATIPIVVPVMGDPVGDGLVASLARPGGNITGLTFLGPELTTKRLELIKLALPRASRVAALWHPGAFAERTTREMLQATEAAAQALGIQLQLVGAQNADEFEGVFSTITAERAEALIVFPSPMLFAGRKRIVELATIHRLPSIAVAREFVELGGVMAYGASITDLQRRSATYVDKILRGAKPADLPVEQPTKFELVINLRAANMLGLKIPPTLLARADEVIE
jgi:ABC-type uncharacterized transport system substrate-binding protein